MQKRLFVCLIFFVIFVGFGLYSMPAAANESTHQYVSGIFIAPEMASDASAQEWHNALRNMHRIGIDTVIVQYTFQTDPSNGDQAFFEYWQQDTLRSAKQHPMRRSQIGYILEAAKTHGIKVYLGLQLAEQEWFEKNRYRKYDWLYHHYWLSCDLADALWDRFGQAYGETIAGWYLPFEFESTEEYYPYFDLITNVYYAPLTSFLKNDGRFGHLPIMISPLMYRDDDKDAWQDNLKTVLSSSAIDIIAPQDGIGFGTQDQKTVGDWYRITKNAVNEINNTYAHKNIGLWANCENYARLRNAKEPIAIERFKPMSINKFIDSLEIVGPYVDKLITFSIHRWDTALYYNKFLGVNKSYYDAYSRYYNTGIRSASKSNGYYVAIEPTGKAELVYNPNANAGLTDGFATENGEWGQYKGIHVTQQKPFTMEIRFDDPTRISSIASHYLQDAQSSISLPKKVTYEYIIRSGKRDQVFTYTQIATDQLSSAELRVLSAVRLAPPVLVDGVRITVTPGGEWTFLDDIWIE